MKQLIIFALAIVATASCAMPGDAQSNTQPKELGQVKWLRNFDEAKKVSAQTGKPILLLFQEVPG